MHAPSDLTPEARRVLDQIEYHPTTHNLGWHDLVVMLKEVATVEESHAGAKVVVHLANQRLELTRPEGTPVSEQTLLELRRMFNDAGFM
jgi:hypothetical protein